MSDLSYFDLNIEKKIKKISFHAGKFYELFHVNVRKKSAL